MIEALNGGQKTRKLDLACGGSCPEGYEGADIARVNDRVVHVLNVLEFPWPFDDGSFDEVRCSHFVEHLPMAYHTPPNSLRTDGHYTRAQNHPDWRFEDTLTVVQVSEASVSLWLKFFDECHRILKPGGTLEIICPHGHSDRAFQDPTHARFVMEATWNYLDRDWRKGNGLEHAAYASTCHFPIATRKIHGLNSPDQDRELSQMPDVVKAQAVGRWWNMISDFRAFLVKEPSLAPAAVEQGRELTSVS